jgi:hypothetical protein
MIKIHFRSWKAFYAFMALWIGFLVYVFFWLIVPLIQSLIHFLNKP